jgi:hypothetical protein
VSRAIPQSTATDTGYSDETTETDRRFVDRLAAVEPYLWGVLVVLLADVVSTYAGLRAGLTEGNPAMRLAIETAGIAALVAVILVVLGLGAGVRRFLDERGAIVPLGLALPWFVAASVNAVHLL